MEVIEALNKLNDELLTKCLIKYEIGFITLNNNGELEFESKVTQQKKVVQKKQLFTLSGSPYKKNVLKTSHDAVKLLVNTPCAYIIMDGKLTNELTFEGEPICPGDVILLSKPLRVYDNYKLFVSEIKTTELPDFEKGKALFKQGKRGNSYIKLDNNEHIEINTDKNLFDTFDMPESQPQTVQKPKSEGRNWNFDRDAEYKDAPYIITKRLVTESDEGGSPLAGYLLQKVTDPNETIKLSINEVMKLARNAKIKNAKVVNKNGKDFLQGIHCSLENMEEDWWN